MENKYFTPDIEDIRVGYECEYLFGGENGIWTNGFGLGSTGFPELWEIKGNPKILRVPYLTKEQIEAEGWKTMIPDSNNIYKKDNYWLIWYESRNFIKIMPIDASKLENIDVIDIWVLYQGECKDINTFRYICKLLKI